jgi:hypothetical protein
MDPKSNGIVINDKEKEIIDKLMSQKMTRSPTQAQTTKGRT